MQLEQVKKAFEDAYHTTKNTADDGGVKYSLSHQTARSDLTKAYQNMVDQVMAGTYGKKEPVLLGYTPTVYQELGMPSLPFVVGPGHIYSIAKTEAEAKNENRYSKNVNYHGLGTTAVKNILDKVADPIMIISSKDVNRDTVPKRSLHSIVAIVDIGANGKSVLAPIEITAERTMNGGQYDVNVLSSAYKKTAHNLVLEAIAQENIGEVGIFYLSKKASTLLADGVQFPKRLTNALASSGIVHHLSEKVNMNIVAATQSQQFKRWFGDWQNNPQTASKHINNEVKQEAVVLVDELINTSKFKSTDPAKHAHSWLDNNGQNTWDVWTTYIQDKNNAIWETILHVANTTKGDKILYDVVPTKKVGQSGKSDTSLPFEEEAGRPTSTSSVGVYAIPAKMSTLNFLFRKRMLWSVAGGSMGMSCAGVGSRRMVRRPLPPPPAAILR